MMPMLPPWATSALFTESDQRQDPCAAEAAGSNGNADDRTAKPVAHGNNQIDAANQYQHGHDDAERYFIDLEPGPDRKGASQQHTQTVAEIKTNPGSPHVRPSTRQSEGGIGHRLGNRRIGGD